MKRLLLGLLATSGICLAAPAMAADLYTAPEPAPVIYDWSGFYIGAVGGYAFGGEFDSNSQAVVHPLGDLLDDAEGAVLGGTLGYNWQFDNIVVGLEADGSWSDVHDDFVTADPEFHADLEWFATLRPRLGFAVDNFLPFITGGLAIGGIELDATDNVVAASDSSSKTHLGWTVGAGLEIGATENLSVKLQYDYVDFGREKHNVSGTGFMGVEDMKLKMHMVRLGVNWRF